MAKKPKRPKDPNQKAKFIVDLATSEEKETDPNKQKGVMKVNAGQQQGGQKGGKARAEKLSPEERKEIAQKAAAKRWDKN